MGAGAAGAGAGRGETGRCAPAAGVVWATTTGCETSVAVPCGAVRTGTVLTAARGRAGRTTLGLTTGATTCGVVGNDRGGGAAICATCGWSTWPQRYALVAAVAMKSTDLVQES